MFPWNYGFHWTVGSAIFLGAFYTVLIVVATTVISAMVRTRRAVASHRVEEIRWQTQFHDLPACNRLCRHMLTGEFSYRECPNAFDCRRCETHAKVTGPRPSVPAENEEEIFGMAFPLDRLYHRGHTWVRAEPDGTVTVGLDELGRRVLGAPEAVELPAAGTELRVNTPAWRVHKRGAEVSVLSPVDGEVAEAGGPDREWYLRVRPRDSGFDLRHLLTPCEVKPWLLREMERLQLTLSAEGAPTMADGGAPVADIAAGYPATDWDAVCGEVFLQG